MRAGTLLKSLVRDTTTRTRAGYRFKLRRAGAARRPRGRPEVRCGAGVLEGRGAVCEALNEVQRLGLPPHPSDPKNWDSLIALSCVLEHTDRGEAVLDAGATLYSVILPWLFLYGYERLAGINLEFEHPIRRGPIRYLPDDLTRTQFADGSFGAVTCLSVVEHGVEWDAYFREMRRILQPGGVLVTSTDYFEHPVGTEGKTAYGQPVRIFSAEDIVRGLDTAASHGFRQLRPFDPASPERPVRWKGLEYTFAAFALVAA
jgi:SAM-dependent methyltransferase